MAEPKLNCCFEVKYQYRMKCKYNQELNEIHFKYSSESI